MDIEGIERVRSVLTDLVGRRNRWEQKSYPCSRSIINSIVIYSILIGFLVTTRDVSFCI